jgi:hypothetical protein
MDLVPGAPEEPVLNWKRSTFCSTSSCVEVTRMRNQIMVRDSKDPEGPALAYSPQEWSAFLSGVKHGEFDGLL